MLNERIAFFKNGEYHFKMKKILSVYLLFLNISPALASSYVFSNCWKYSGIRATEEHSYGEELFLWKTGGEYEGVFIFQCGMSGSPIRASLEKVVFDEKSKKVSFSAMYSSGLSMSKDAKQLEPTKESINFQGEIKKSAIEGMLKFTSAQSCEKGPNFKIKIAKLPNCSEVEFEKQFYEERRSGSK